MVKLVYSRDLHNFSVKGQRVNNAGFGVYRVSVVTTQLCGDRNAATDNM